jgi:hypothetical protein
LRPSCRTTRHWPCASFGHRLNLPTRELRRVSWCVSVEAEALEGQGQKPDIRQGLPQSNDQPSLAALTPPFFDSIDPLLPSPLTGVLGKADLTWCWRAHRPSEAALIAANTEPRCQSLHTTPDRQIVTPVAVCAR